MVNTRIRVDSRGFDRAYKDYIDFSKKSLPEIANKTIFEIAKIATTTTKFASKEEIAANLRAPSRDFNAPLAAILINSMRGDKDKKGLRGPAMAKAVESYIKRKQKTAKFILSGWIASVKAIAPFVRMKAGAPMPTGTTRSVLGGGMAARNINNKATASIWNSVFGGKSKGNSPSRVQSIQMEGLEKAIRIKTADMEKYIRGKLKEGAKRWR